MIVLYVLGEITNVILMVLSILLFAIDAIVLALGKFVVTLFHHQNTRDPNSQNPTNLLYSLLLFSSFLLLFSNRGSTFCDTCTRTNAYCAHGTINSQTCVCNCPANSGFTGTSIHPSIHSSNCKQCRMVY